MLVPKNHTELGGWCIPIILAIGETKAEVSKFKATMDTLARPFLIIIKMSGDVTQL